MTPLSLMFLVAALRPPVRVGRHGAIACGFDDTLQTMLAKAECVGPRAAVAHSIDEMNEWFLPKLDERLAAAEATGDESLQQLLSVKAVLLAFYDAPLKTRSDRPEEHAQRAMVDSILASHWQTADGEIDADEEAFVDTFDRPEGSPPLPLLERPSAYGEVTHEGARQLFVAMELQGGAVFADLGSGARRLVAQAWFEMPAVRTIGVELAPTRHAAAVRAWASVVSCGAAATFGHGQRGDPEFRQASMLSTDLSAVTHCYVASLLMGDELMNALWATLQRDAPKLKVVATLRAFRGDAAAEALAHVARVDMTWNEDGDSGTDVFIYRL